MSHFRQPLPAVSVVIGAYNEEKHIGKCLASLVRQETVVPFEVILVNNGSTDGTVEVANSFNNRLPLRILNEPLKGRGSAKRTGFDAAHGNIICSTDADNILPPDWIERYYALFEEHPEVSAVAGISCTSDFAPLSNIIINTGWLLSRYLYRFTMGYYYCTANYAIRRAAYDACGRFSVMDDGTEDIDMSHRMKNIGTIVFAPRIKVITSGRRFKDGILAGAYEYFRIFFYKHLAKKRSVLSDLRM